MRYPLSIGNILEIEFKSNFMKRLFLIASLFVCCLACTNEKQKDGATSQPGNSAAPDTGSRRDTASYERMPQQNSDSSGK
jgi:hypothetical protein